MTEVLFTLTTIFVAYVVYTIVNEQKMAAKPAEHEVPKVQAVVVESIKPKPVAAKIAAKKESPVAVKKPAAAPAIPNAGKGSVRNPKTGEIATVTNNYRFTKRWIKEALVSEGLLGKVYKNNELDTATEAAIKTALLKLESMDQYRP